MYSVDDPFSLCKRPYILLFFLFSNILMTTKGRGSYCTKSKQSEKELGSQPRIKFTNFFRIVFTNAEDRNYEIYLLVLKRVWLSF